MKARIQYFAELRHGTKFLLASNVKVGDFTSFTKVGQIKASFLKEDQTYTPEGIFNAVYSNCEGPFKFFRAEDEVIELT